MIDQVTKRVQEKFPQSTDQDVRDLVTRAHHRFDASTIRDFVPVLVEREVLEEIRTHGTAPRL